jgi:hypothetical protein
MAQVLLPVASLGIRVVRALDAQSRPALSFGLWHAVHRRLILCIHLVVFAFLAMGLIFRVLVEDLFFELVERVHLEV